MMADYFKYLKVTADGKTFISIKKWQQDHKNTRAAYRAFCEQYCGKDSYAGYRLCGLSFVGEPPAGWFVKKGDPKNCYRPHARRTVCQAAYQAFKLLPSRPDSFSFLSELRKTTPEMDLVVRHDGSAGLPTFEAAGNVFLLGSPIKADGTYVEPADCEPLKMSEYWELKEQTPEAA